MNDNSKNILYFDYASTTPVDQRVVAAMEPYWYKVCGNPSSLHYKGREAKDILDEKRVEMADLIGAKTNEIYFTSGGTESNNWALFGLVNVSGKKGQIIISSIEHKSVLYPANILQKRGYTVEVCPVNKVGLVDLDKLEQLVGDNTILVSVVYANNEIGVVQDLNKISKLIKKKNPDTYFHTDACQALNYLETDVGKLGVDLMTFNASKVYGPKGVGCLYIKEGVKISPFLYGGGQERAMRSGTENLPLIVGMVEAIKIARRISTNESSRLALLRDKIISRVKKEIPDSYLNGDGKKRLPNNVNLSFAGCEGESLVLYLDEAGFCVSTGSACSASDLEPSHVLLALGMKKGLAHGSLRISLGRWTNEEGVDRLSDVLPGVVEKVRMMSAI
ncbi:cysteine desulfurase [Patescibacteria group bacterium]|nr:cysteine desulfurase [Patescibacteria group bacterium]